MNARLSHRRRRPVFRTERAQRDHGYVLVEFAFLLVPLLFMVGLSVDVGAWYNRTSSIQKAADAAALAGVVWLPNVERAEEYALEAAERNGFVDGVNDVTVTVAQVGERRLRVTIVDARVESFFFQGITGKSININRRGTAEYILPVPLGSPENRLGNDPQSSPVFTPNLWASISAVYADKTNGDPFATKCTNGSSGSNCSKTNTEYRSTGYLYVVDVPAGTNRNLSLSVYDAGQYERGNYPRVETADNGDVNTSFELFSPDITPLDPYDGLTSEFSMSGECNAGTGRWRLANEASPDTYKNKWVNLCTINNVPAGKYLLQVKSSDIPGIADGGSGWNQFSLKASMTGTGAQPAVYTIGDLSLFNNLPGTSGTFSSTFYLAKIESIHKGKTLEVSLYDPGDGTDPASGTASTYTMNVLKPGGVTSACKYQVRGATTSTSLTSCAVVTRSNRTNTYNGKWLDIQLSIPDNYSCTTDCWWKIRYDFKDISSGFSPNDRTVWAARIIGDPVHLVEEDN